MWLDVISSKPYPSVIQRSFAYQVKDDALNVLCSKTLGILSFYSATKKVNILWGKYVFERHCTSDDQMNAIFSYCDWLEDYNFTGSKFTYNTL